MEKINIIIDEATTLVLADGSTHSGTVTVDPDTAKQLLDTGRASVVVATVKEAVDGTTGNA